MIILGIDPGFGRTGFAVLEKIPGRKKECVLFSECFKTPAELEFPDRLKLIGERVVKIIEKYDPETLAIETLFLNTNQKTAMRVAETRGVIINVGKKAGLRIFEVTPLQVKMSVAGYGRADKKQVIKMVKLLVDIDTTKKSDDELDAVAIALTAFAYRS